MWFEIVAKMCELMQKHWIGKIKMRIEQNCRMEEQKHSNMFLKLLNTKFSNTRTVCPVRLGMFFFLLKNKMQKTDM